jgi:methylated-DNA-[protein]-cysteine S-methyltransferase
MKATMSGKNRVYNSVSCAVFKTSIGWCGLVMAQGKVRRLYIGYAAPRELKQHIRNAFGDYRQFNRPAGMRTIIQKLKRYCSGKRVSLSGVPMDWSSLTAFQQKVLRAAAGIPPGSVDTYAGLARKIGYPRGARAVGNALGSNPFPLLIPCHRIIRTDGSIGGFSARAGVSLKKSLLRSEREKTI